MTCVFIAGRNIYLRPLQSSDFGERYLSWLNEPGVNQFSQRRFLPTDDDGMRGLKSSANAIHLAVCLKGTERHVGNISLNPINWMHRFATLQIMIGEREVWNRGVGKEAIYLMCRHGLRTLGLHRIEADSVNPAFVRATAKLGWSEEGRARGRFFRDGDFLDVVHTALLAQDFAIKPEFEPTEADEVLEATC